MTLIFILAFSSSVHAQTIRPGGTPGGSGSGQTASEYDAIEKLERKIIRVALDRGRSCFKSTPKLKNVVEFKDYIEKHIILDNVSGASATECSPEEKVSRVNCIVTPEMKSILLEFVTHSHFHSYAKERLKLKQKDELELKKFLILHSGKTEAEVEQIKLRSSIKHETPRHIHYD